MLRALMLFRVVVLHLPPFTELWDPDEGYDGDAFVRDHVRSLSVWLFG